MDDYIGEIGNMYGGLMVKEEQGKYFWAIEDVNDLYWQEIPYSLYSELVKFGRGSK